jgi:lipopolysaccharide transport system permease protein
MTLQTYPVQSPLTKIRQVFILLGALVYRDISVRYRRSMLGPLWAVLQPLILMVVFGLLRGIVGISSEGVPYLLFSGVGLVPWTFFSNAVVYCGPSITLNANIIKKIALAREVFPLAAVTTALFDFVMASLVLCGIMAFYQVRVNWTLLWIPVLCLIAGALAFGIGLVIAALGAFKRDFVMATPFLTQVWLIATPVIYPLSEVPTSWRMLYQLNPMVGVIEGFRSVLLRAEMPELSQLGWSVLMTIGVLALTWPIFRHLSRYFADVV